MRDDEVAWCMAEFLKGRTQKEIAAEFNVTSGCVSGALMRFYHKFGLGWQKEFSHLYDYNQRRTAYYKQALARYFDAGHNSKKPARRPLTPDWVNEDGYPWRAYSDARYEHAWLLCAEGLTLQKVGDHLGVGRERARQMIFGHGRRVSQALKHTKVTISGGSNDLLAPVLYSRWWGDDGELFNWNLTTNEIHKIDLFADANPTF